MPVIAQSSAELFVDRPGAESDRYARSEWNQHKSSHGKHNNAEDGKQAAKSARQPYSYMRCPGNTDTPWCYIVNTSALWGRHLTINRRMV